MKLLTKTTALAAIVAGTMLTMGTASAALSGVAATKHNLGSTGTGVNKVTGFDTAADDTEICVFCHTPHGSVTAIKAPLWNKAYTAQSYNTYADMASTTLDGEIDAVGSVSIACLSCHDGVQAMDVMSNEQGSGQSTFATATWTGANQTAGVMTGFAAVGLDSLQNDHPIGIQYGGGGITAGAPTASTKDVDFTVAKTAPLNASVIWWVDTAPTGGGGGGTSDTREKQDMILYSRIGETSSVVEPFVECATCHDPHTENTTFLRIPNENSEVCLACHVK